jgi:hypothetical protein
MERGLLQKVRNVVTPNEHMLPFPCSTTRLSFIFAVAVGTATVAVGTATVAVGTAINLGSIFGYQMVFTFNFNRTPFPALAK